jgi:hypothetical protein
VARCPKETRSAAQRVANLVNRENP